MDRDRFQDIVDAQVRAWQAADGQAVAAMFSPDGVLVSPGGAWRGRDAIAGAVQLFHDHATIVSVTVHALVVDGDRAALEWTWEEHRHDEEEPRVMEDAIVAAFDGDLITYWREYFDPEQRRPLDIGG